MRIYTRQPLDVQFWKQVNKTESCWLWMGAKFKSGGYGAIKVGGRKGPVLRAHRVSWELHDGPIPEGMWVLHVCDVPACVNPEHLFLGTTTDNMRDAAKKLRMPQQRTIPLWHGERHGNAKLTNEDARSIRSLWPQLSYSALSKQFGVCKTVIAGIVKRTGWKHVT